MDVSDALKGLEAHLQLARLRQRAEFPLLIYEMTSDEIARLEDRLRPGNHSDVGSFSGFLAVGERLREVVNRDSETILKLNLTYEDIANRLRNLFFKGIELRYLGSQYCPWGDGECTNADYKFRDPDGDTKNILVSGLLPHLIEVHHFFEGSVKYRLSPEKILEIIK